MLVFPYAPVLHLKPTYADKTQLIELWETYLFQLDAEDESAVPPAGISADDVGTNNGVSSLHQQRQMQDPSEDENVARAGDDGIDGTTLAESEGGNGRLGSDGDEDGHGDAENEESEDREERAEREGSEA